MGASGGVHVITADFVLKPSETGTAVLVPRSPYDARNLTLTRSSSPPWAGRGHWRVSGVRGRRGLGLAVPRRGNVVWT
jgi:hypothetical protein